MSLYDRDYGQSDFRQRHIPPMGLSLPRVTPVVKNLLIINIAVFVASAIVPPIGAFIYKWFSVEAIRGDYVLAISFWRYISYQFLHANFWHIAFNMLWLYFLGPLIEKTWGGRKFLKFYLICGAAGGVLFQVLVQIGWLTQGSLVGASGAILGLLAACAILFPAMRIYLMFVPMGIPIRIFAAGSMLVYIFILAKQGNNAGGHAAHLAGMAAGAVYIFSQSWIMNLKHKSYASNMQKRIHQEVKLRQQVDDILEKVHDKGIANLTSREKKILKKATQAEQKRKFS